MKVFKRSFEPRGMFRKQSELIWTNIKHFEENLKKSFFSNFQGFLRAHRRLGPGISSQDYGFDLIGLNNVYFTKRGIDTRW